MVDIRINTIFYDNARGLLRITLPVMTVPEEMMRKLKENGDIIQKERDRLFSKGVTGRELTKRLKEFKVDNSLEDLFAVFLNLDNNLNILTYRLGEDKNEYLTDLKKIQIIQETMNSITTKYKLPNPLVIPLKRKHIETEESYEKEEDEESNEINLKALILLDKLNDFMGRATDYSDEYEDNDEDDQMIDEVAEFLKENASLIANIGDDE